MDDYPTFPSKSNHEDDTQSLSSSVRLLASHNICVHQLVQQQCEAYPASSAINAWDGNLTYGELEQKSSRLAIRLMELGVKPEVIVPLCFDKSMWTAVAILAVLKAGGAFVLLDLAFPLNRLKEICLAVNASIVLTSPSRADLARSLVSLGATVIVDGRLASVTGCRDQTESIVFSNLAMPESACYVVFTSGSTGKPKGIVMPHSAMATSITKNHGPLFLRRDSRVLQFAAYAFDLSVYDHLFTLATGACLCVPSEASRLSALANAFLQFSVNWVTLTPSVARILDPEQLPGLKVLALAGEAITRTDLDRWSPHVHLLGLYGPAEFAHAATIRDFTASPSDSANIGYSHNAVCWVVDRNGNTCQCSDGQEGELILEGPCLSRGYLNYSAPSMAPFLNGAPWVPSSRSINTQLYRTGDIVRYNLDGSLQFLGRKDTQVKVSGQRIELGEVEFHLREALQEADDIVVEVVSFSTQGAASLIAFIQLPLSWNAHLYLEASKDTEFQTVTKKAGGYLRQHLPPYMVPGNFLRVHRIPMMRTGKTDRKALRQEAEKLLAAQLKGSTDNCTEHHGGLTVATEGTLIKLCRKVLGIPLQSQRDDIGWLQLGGDSLLAMKLVDQARSHGICVSVADILGAKSLAQLVTKMKYETVASVYQHIEPFCLLPNQTDRRGFVIRKALEQCQVPLSSLEDLYPCTAHQLVSIPYMIKGQCNLTLRLRCQLPADVDQAKFICAWDISVSSNPLFRTRIIEADWGCYYQAVTRDPIVLDLETDLRKPTTDLVVDLFGFGVPLVQAYFHENIFVMSIHHLLIDGYSFPLVFRDIERAYQGQTLPRLSFSPFVQWSSRLDERSKQFWSSSFAGFKGEHFPPVPPPGYTPLETAQLQRELHFPPRDKFTPSNKIRLALAVTFARNLHIDKVVYGDLLARRAAPIPGISDMAVPSASLLPICFRVDMKSSLGSNLGRIQSEAAERTGFEGIDKELLRGLSAEAKAACDYQTVLIIQAEGTDTFHGLFKEATTEYGHAPGLWSLCLECWLTSNTVSIKTRFDENVLSKEKASKFLDCLEFVFNAIIQNPTLNPADLKADFEF
ncbi:hypothetical protein N7471_007061 [Penicillium samsonianum]|uniref:uncharacterized protein n=1 Tax=Penicillium samsonianum TaxID=1882272 RepID=UPI00254841BD|nr:uncharacterized protein N7471_007061 [Penicillium samsonianum]KAJ6131846.1 hypothetical protein N7471_007061 [Penicillium samsonianum]